MLRPGDAFILTGVFMHWPVDQWKERLGFMPEKFITCNGARSDERSFCVLIGSLFVNACGMHASVVVIDGIICVMWTEDLVSCMQSLNVELD